MAALADDEAATTGENTASTAVAEESEPFKILTGESEIEKLTDTYEEKRTALEEVNGKIAELQAQIDEVEAELPAQQTRSDAGLKQRYIMQSNPLIIVDSLLSSGTLGEFIKQTEYLEKASNANLREYNRLRDMRDQLDRARAEQTRLREEAESQFDEAQAALREAQDKRSADQASAQALAVSQAATMGGANSIDKKEEEKDDDKSKESKSSKNSKDAKVDEKDDDKNSEPQIEATTDTTGIDDGIDWHVDRDVFLDEWSARIDEYLEGSPLAGQGASFAAAAWKYGVDPRWSPAISNMESSKGAYCIRPHNAWGWGAADSDPYGLALEWKSWEEAIDAHVKGLADGYGYTISMGKAKTYCPPNWQRWYNTILHDMGSM